MLELRLKTRRGSFCLQAECSLASPWTVLFGPSGSGKTTLLRIVAGLDGASLDGAGLDGAGFDGAGLDALSRRTSAKVEPDRVRVALDGKLLTDSDSGVAMKPGPRAWERRTCFVTQQSALFPHLSVAANVAYGLPHGGDGERREIVEQALALAGASSLLNRRVTTLSGGERQRVALARALAPGPRLLLLDEPFSALGGAASDELLIRLKDWAAQKKAQVVMATHDAADALAVRAEVALLAEGRLTALGPAAEVLAAERARLLERLG